MKDLIERLEKLTGPDRELDRDIWLAITPGAAWKTTHITGHASGREWDVDEARVNGGRLVGIPAYTASVDSALTLIPDGKGWNVQGNTSIFYATVAGHDNMSSPTPAIALVIAALRARAALTGEAR